MSPELDVDGIAVLGQQILDQLDGPWVAVMVYGSRVRGDFTDSSDIDVLQLTEEPGPNYSKGLLTVTVRAVWQLRRLCHDGDLYALSLTREGRIVADPTGILAQTLGGFLPPPDNWARKWREFQMRLAMLDALTPEAFEANRVNLVRASLYLVRNVCMLAYLRRFGEPCFSVPELARALGVADLPELFEGRADPANLTRARLDHARKVLGQLFATA
jgi:Predicted nucleotidyltransferases